MTKVLKKDTRWLWIALGLGTVLLRYVLNAFPQFIETYYSRGLFLFIRQVLDHSLGLLPFPLFLPLLTIVLLLLLRGIVRLIKGNNSRPQKLLQAIFSVGAIAGALVFFFLFLWGFNYGRIPIEKQLGLSTVALSEAELSENLEEETQWLIQSRDSIPWEDDNALSGEQLPPHLEILIRQYVQNTLQELGYPANGHPNARLLWPRGLLLRISTAGFYLPFTGECNVDTGLHPIQMPFVMAHEFAHGYGIANEGACNFIAYLACRKATEPFTRYSGHFGYWRYLLSSYYRQDPEAYSSYKKNLPPGIIADLESIKENSLKYPDILPKIRNYTYDAYLKAQGVNDGLKNYNRVVLLVNGWKKKQKGIGKY